MCEVVLVLVLDLKLLQYLESLPLFLMVAIILINNAE